jgi:hypothetical protein
MPFQVKSDFSLGRGPRTLTDAAERLHIKSGTGGMPRRSLERSDPFRGNLQQNWLAMDSTEQLKRLVPPSPEINIFISSQVPLVASS